MTQFSKTILHKSILPIIAVLIVHLFKVLFQNVCSFHFFARGRHQNPGFKPWGCYAIDVPLGSIAVKLNFTVVNILL